MPGQSGIESKLPVFTTPQQQIIFYADDPLSFKQILTIYNPYDFLVKFRISCTDCSKYTVSAAQGSIKSNHSIDIVVHHKAVFPSNIGISDTVRIQLYTSGQVRAGGKKDLSITLLNTAPRERVPAPFIDTKRFQTLDSDSTGLGDSRQNPLLQEHTKRFQTLDSTGLGDSRQNPLLQERNKSKAFIYLSLFVMCGVILWMPLVGEESSWIEYIPRITCLYKIVAAFILGVVVATAVKT